MLDWFVKDAPIRTKFAVLISIQAVLSGAGVILVLAAGGSAPVMAAALALAVTAVAILAYARGAICTPYVQTVQRMEALAAGDVDAPVRFTEYRDCVGRMTKAMAIFRNNALELRKGRAAEEREIINSLSDGLGHLAANNLEFRLEKPFPGAYDAVRRDFNAAAEALATALQSVRAAASGVLVGASEIRAASDDLAQRNERQAASLEETAVAMNQITGKMVSTAERAGEVQQTIGAAHREASEGGEVVTRATEAMSAIESSAREISQIINVIDGIAFQTNLLALNAGVEAARAGDAGKGFAVVANEVRALAQRSANAARDIKELITLSSRQVADGVMLVGEAGGLLERIVGGVGEISALVTEIADTAHEQAQNLRHVNTSVGEMDRMTQQNAAMVEQATAAARSLASEAHELTALVDRFRMGESEDRPAYRPAARSKPSIPSIPRVQGNLALAPEPAAAVADQADDWSEF
ncbi:methyl-accepting chemotaxis protein [Novosphingobium sp. NBM11]|uniref:methyl-accepting chemotaxis protein n=1 Tax=Novosphingobium sp. NBM11 TaxID=2596914 RepID=UPI0018920100|nr:methyl-accepting chemotaxis protein [Novosphingobium sp. NBM11]MBF5092593.1 methyl-accepting chemotaxis protein [Novosphingobium sp. NBM11]